MLGANCSENGGDTLAFCGEVDILELYGSKDDEVEANIHYANREGSMISRADCLPPKEGRFADEPFLRLSGSQKDW